MSSAFDKYQANGLQHKPETPPTGGSGVTPPLKGVVVQNRDDTVIVVGDDTYKLPLNFHVKLPMTNAEEARFIGALSNHKDGLINMEELKRIAANPSMYNSFGYPVEAVPAVNAGKIMGMSQEKFIERNRVLEREDNAKSRQEKLDKAVQAYVLGRMTLTALMTEVLSDFDMVADGSPAIKLLQEFDGGKISVGDLQEKLRDLVFFPDKVTPSDKVNHPSHYTQYKGVEIIEITEKLNFNRGNAVKYIARAGFKDEDTEIQDLEKALWYVERQIEFGDDGSLALLTFDDVEKLCGQMNFHRGNAVWLICLAGQQGGKTKQIDLTEATHSIRTEIKRLKEYSE